MAFNENQRSECISKLFADGTDESSDRDIQKDFQTVSYKLKWDSLKDARL